MSRRTCKPGAVHITERELISERKIAGLASARARGRTGCRPFTMTPAKVRLAMASMGKPDTNVNELCKELGISRQTLYRHVSLNGEARPNGASARPQVGGPKRPADAEVVDPATITYVAVMSGLQLVALGGRKIVTPSTCGSCVHGESHISSWVSSRRIAQAGRAVGSGSPSRSRPNVDATSRPDPHLSPIHPVSHRGDARERYIAACGKM